MSYKSIERLRKILVQELSNAEIEKPILLPFDTDLLKDIMFEDNVLAVIPGEVLYKIDFSNISFDGYDLQRGVNDFSGFTGIKINPQTIKNKDLSSGTFSNVEFIGPFDGVKIKYSNFTGSKGVKINPQTIYNNDATYCVFSDVEFIGEFDGVAVSGADFEGSKRAKINPQTIYSKMLKETKCADVEFIGPFDDVSIARTNFKGSKGAKINPQTIKNKDFVSTNCADVEFIGSFENINFNYTQLEGSNYNEIINFEKDFREKIKTLVLKNLNNTNN